MLKMKNLCSTVKREEQEKNTVSSYVFSRNLMKKEQLIQPDKSVQTTTANSKNGCWNFGFDASSPLCICCVLLEKNNPEICR